ncbi:hypothetical protein [Olivibacter sp. XZL3]|uniref:hypothetical protein n=1 Tax=Olivibacter sp. XZL3 TaxID=1735116 RepID=UPI001066F88D|nr:hypothetical protein [Olivibacter sp. XZL3]
MQRLKFSLIIFALSLCLANAQAQNTTGTPAKTAKASQGKPPQGLNGGSIASQFDYINSSSNNFQEYKVVRKTSLEKLEANITDSIKAMQVQLANIHGTLSNHDNEVASLKDSLQHVGQELKAAKEQKESFSFLGILLPKSTYNLLVWCIIGILALALIFYIYRYSQSHLVTADAKKTLEELRAEFDQHRKKAMEREQKLNRQLQDELNKRL